jgi:hypothetical protein
MNKVKLLDLPPEVLKFTLIFLQPEKLLNPIMAVCKKLNELAADPTVMSTCFFNALKVPVRYGVVEFGSLSVKERASIMKDIFWANGLNEKVNTVAYYTDGGVDKGTSKYFISNIYAENPTDLYSSIRGSNIHVKALLSDTLSSRIDLTDVSKYKVPPRKANLYKYPDNTYLLPIKSLLSQYDPQNSKQFGVLKYHDLNRNIPNYTCFLQSFALFISMEEIDVNHPLVRLFDDIKKKEHLDKLGFQYISLQSTEDTQVVEFELYSIREVEKTLQKNTPGAKLDGVYPLLWGDVSKNNVNYLNITQRIGFRFMLLKLIDSHKSKDDSNIDCYTISLSGVVIKLKSSYEE